MPIQISIVNQSSFLDADLPALAQALQTQISRDFYPAWGVQCQVYWTPKGSHPTADHWALVLLDHADAAGVLGYHDTTPAGLPLGKVFVKTIIADGQKVSVTASHEILEILGDPQISLAAELDSGNGAPSKFYAYENCDPCEALEYTINIPAHLPGGPAEVAVSDFVFPSWFEGFRASGPFDYLGKISKPFQLLSGGYISYLDLGNLGAGWQQVMAKEGISSQAIMAARPRPGSRRSRRALPRAEWLVSTYEPGDIAHPVVAS